MFIVRRFPEPNSPFNGPRHSKICTPSMPTESLVTAGSEEKEAITLSFDVPGVKKEDVSIEEHDGVLGVLAERKSSDTVVARLEKKYKIDKRLVDLSSIQAELADGVLNVVLPKNKDVKREPTTIAVTPGYPELANKNEDADATKDESMDKEFRFSTDIPGVRLDDLEIKLIDIFGTDTSHLNIHATRQKGSFLAEIHRQCSIPAKRFDTTKIQAFLVDGVLTVVAPPRIQVAEALSVPRKIPIGTTSLPLLDTTTNDAMDTTEDKEVIVETVKEA